MGTPRLLVLTPRRRSLAISRRPEPFQNPRRPSPSPGRDYNRPGAVTSHLDPRTRARSSRHQGPHRRCQHARGSAPMVPSQAGCTLRSWPPRNALGDRASASSTEDGADVDPDRFDPGAFGGRPLRRRSNAAKPARALAFPGGGALEVTVKSERLIQVDGRKLFVRCSGTGPPVLLLTGMGMSLAAWTPFLRHLRGFECIEVAVPGNEGSVARRPVLTMPKFAALARGLLDRLDIARGDVLGLSFGGLVAQQLAYDAPTRVRGLVLVSTFCGLGGVPSNPASWWNAMLSGVGPPLAGRVRSGWRGDGRG